LTKEEISLEIKPVWLKLAEPLEKWGPLFLMHHQVACRNVQRPNFTLISAPPSGGKTLASLARVIQRFEVDKNTQGAIFIYPTNALLEDQGESIKKLLSEKNYRVTILNGEQLISENVPSSDLRLLIVNGPMLDAYLEKGFKRKGEALIKILSDHQNTIMLTNPDTLTLIFKGYYYRPSTLMKKFLNAFEGCTLVLDEFHLYHGAALAWILYIAWLIRHKIDDVIVSSATLAYQLSNFEDLFRDRLQLQIKAKSGQKGHKARKRVSLTLTAGNPPSKLSDRDLFIKKTKELYNETSSHNGTCLLVLVDSVAFCDYLAQRLINIYGEEKVGVIHGFVPYQVRKDALQKDIVIGTKAVELGIDFDVPALIFEASDSASFIQRLGRAGRHRDARVVGVIDKITLARLKKLDGLEVDYFRLEEEITRWMVTPRSYLEFIKSREATKLYLSILYSYFKRMPGRSGLDKIRDFINRKKQSNQLDAVVPFLEQKHYIYRMSTTISVPLLEALSRCFLRGYNAGIIAYHLGYSSFSQINIFDISRFEVEYFDSLGDLEQHLGRSLEPPPRLRKNEGIVLLKELRLQRFPISGKWEYRKGLLVLERGKNFHLDPSVASDEKLRNALDKSLDGMVGWTHTAPRPSDWRFQGMSGVYHSRNFRGRGYLVIGLDALVQRYLDERNGDQN
jgi:CRISPR-associated helicase Cas3